MNIKALQQRRADLKKEADGIFVEAGKNGNTLTGEQRKRLDEITAEQVTVAEDIKRWEVNNAIQLGGAPADDLSRRGREWSTEEEAEPRPMSWRGAQRPRQDHFDVQFGAFLQRVAAAGGFHGQGVSFKAAATGLGEAIPADGGYLVEKDMSQEILTRMYDVGQILPRCRQINVSGNGIKIKAVDETSRATGSRWGGVRAYWTDEGGDLTASKPKFRLMDLTLHKATALYYASDELLEDQAALGSITSQAFPEEILFLVEDAIINGDGAGKPVGILNAGCLVTVSKETGQAAATIVVENIVKMYARMWGRSRRNGAWFGNQDIEPQLFTQGLSVGFGGVPLFMPPGGLQDAQLTRILGRPLETTEYNATLGTVGDLLLADFSQYQIAKKPSIQQASSMHVRFVNDEMTFRFVWRVDGQPIWNAALTPFKGSNTVSPFVALATRA